LLGVGRSAYVSLWIMGDGQSLSSPNMRYSANAVTYVRPTFFGGTERWSRLFVVDAVGRTLWETRIHSDVDQPWRESGVLSWQPDSSFVVFELAQINAATLRLQSAPFPGSPSIEEIADDLDSKP